MRLRFHLIIGTLFILAGFLMNPSFFINMYHSALESFGYGNSNVTTGSVFAQNNDANTQGSSGATPNIPTAPAAPVVSASAISGTPVRIEVPRLALNVAVQPGYYDSAAQSWTLSKNAAHYAVMTTPANNVSGNTFIYGHNRSSVFSKLLGIRSGDIVIVRTDNGHSFTYVYRSSYNASPQDVSLFSYSGKPILTLQTCSGVFFQDRRLFTFDLKEAA